MRRLVLFLVIGLAAILSSFNDLNAASGYWKQQGKTEYWNKKVPPNGPVNHENVDRSGYDVKVEPQTGKVRYTNTARSGAIIVTEVTWTQPPAVMKPGEVVPVSGRIQVLKGSKEYPGSGTLYCQICTSTPGEISNLFAGLNNSLRSGTTGAYREISNTKNVAPKGSKGQKVYLRYQAAMSGGLSFEVATPYVWVEPATTGQKQ